MNEWEYRCSQMSRFPFNEQPCEGGMVYKDAIISI